MYKIGDRIKVIFDCILELTQDSKGYHWKCVDGGKHPVWSTGQIGSAFHKEYILEPVDTDVYLGNFLKSQNFNNLYKLIADENADWR